MGLVRRTSLPSLLHCDKVMQPAVLQWCTDDCNKRSEIFPIPYMINILVSSCGYDLAWFED
jgi:hypothetical protein